MYSTRLGSDYDFKNGYLYCSRSDLYARRPSVLNSIKTSATCARFITGNLKILVICKSKATSFIGATMTMMISTISTSASKASSKIEQKLFEFPEYRKRQSQLSGCRFF